MTPAELLSELRTRGIVVAAKGDLLHLEAPKGVLTSSLKDALVAHKAELIALIAKTQKAATFDIEGSKLAAAKFVNTLIGDVWIVVDDQALAEHPDIIRSGLPVFYFSEIPKFEGRSVEDLKAIGLVKSVFPSARVLQ